MTEILFDWARGQLSDQARLWTAAAPAILLLFAAFVSMLVYGYQNRARGPYHDKNLEDRGASLLLGMWLRRWFSWSQRPILSLVLKTRLPPAAITMLALLLATAAAAAMAAGRLALGGWLYIAAGACDALDGRVARERKMAGPEGAMLDSVVDRYVDGVAFIGLGWFYRDTWVLAAAMLGLLGALLVPYVRAKGEALGVQFPNVGVAQRPERVAILGVTVAFSPVLEVLLPSGEAGPNHWLAVVGIVLVAAASHLTSAQRLLYARQSLNPKGSTLQLLGRGGMVRNVLTAVLATLCDFGLVMALMHGHEVSLPVATFLGCILGAVVNFTANRVWAFGSHTVPVVQASRYALVSASSAVLNSGLVTALMLQPSMPASFAWAAVRALVFLTWNYPLQRDYVFEHELEVSEN